METTKKESRFSANFPYLIIAILFLVILYFWFETYDVSRLRVPIENITKDDIMTFVVIWGCLICSCKSVKNYFTK